MASLLDLFVKVGVDDQASTPLSKIASTATTSMKVAATAAVGAVATLTKSAVSAYANYEQLVGGVETLFGAGGKSISEYAKEQDGDMIEIAKSYNTLMEAQNQVLANADNAYASAGMSANDYMETVTSFAAALNSSLGGDTVEAARYADMAVTDMADNANKMGTDISSIQNAYQGFAKQNYTMLDNLKLGYGGTQEEMKRLLSDASKISGVKYNISSYADIVDAIHVVQTEMGITGTTAKEAATTISGSVSSMKAAWVNWLTGLGNSDADMTGLTKSLLGSAKTVITNIKPIVQNILKALTDTFQQDGPELIGEAMTFIFDNLPDIAKSALALLTGLANGIKTNLPTLLATGGELVSELATGLINAIPTIVSGAGEVIGALKDAFLEGEFNIDLSGITDALGGLAPIVYGVVAAIAVYNGVMAAVKAANAAAAAAQALLNAAMNANPFVLVATLIAGVVTALVTLYNTNEDFRAGVQAAWAAVSEAISTAATAIAGFMTAAWDTITAVWGTVSEYFSAIWANIVAAFTPAAETLSGFFSAAWEAIQTAWGVAEGYFSAVWGSISAIFEAVTDVLSGDFSGAWEAIKAGLDGWASYFTDIWGDIKDVFSGAVDIGAQIIEDIKSGISSAWEGLTSWFTNLWNNLFGNKSVDVSVNASDNTGPGKAIGMSYVPYNGFPATLHRGEAILTSGQAEQWRRGNSGNQGITIVQNIQSVPQTPVQLAAATQSYFTQARWAI